MVATCKNGAKGCVCRRRSVLYLLSCDICSAKEAGSPGANDEETTGTEETTASVETTANVERKKEKLAPFCYVGEASRSSAERCREHYDGLKNSDEQAPMFKHKANEHENEDITFTMSVLKRFPNSFARMCAESVAIEMRNGSLCNSKNSFNRCSIPRLSIITGDKLHTIEEENEKDVELDEETIFSHNARRLRKKPRNYDDRGHNSGNSGPKPSFPPPKRRKCMKPGKFHIDRADPEASIVRVHSEDLNARTVTQTQLQQQQASSLPSPKYFSIFNSKPTKRLEQQGNRSRGCRNRRKTVIPPNFKFKQISDHFVALSTSLGPDDPAPAKPDSGGG